MTISSGVSPVAVRAMRILSQELSDESGDDRLEAFMSKEIDYRLTYMTAPELADRAIAKLQEKVPHVLIRGVFADELKAVIIEACEAYAE